MDLPTHTTYILLYLCKAYGTSRLYSLHIVGYTNFMLSKGFTKTLSSFQSTTSLVPPGCDVSEEATNSPKRPL